MDSMKLCISNSYVVWLLSALFEMSGQLSARYYIGMLSRYIIGMLCTHLLIFTKCESALKPS